MTQRPIVFLDIDGTLLPLGPGDRSRSVDIPQEWRAQSNPQLAKLRRTSGYNLLRLGAELVWATAWGQDANDVVAPILALGRLPVVDFDQDDDVPVPGGLHWKAAALVRFAAGRPFVWLDDEIRDLDVQWVEAAHPGPALLHHVSPTLGLTEDDAAAVEAWVREVAGPPVPEDVPPPLRAIMDACHDYDDGRGVAFEPYPGLEPVAETGWWFRHWTGSPEVTGQEFRPFGQDGGGGYVCSWTIRPGADLADQPVIYLGSDGDVAVLAADAWDALWFFAHGYGPHDVPSEFEPGERYFQPEPDRVVRPHAELVRAAELLAPGRRRPVEQIVAEAPAGLPDLRVWVDGLCR
ncbi:HAD domain-containing protein [Promicromonospora sp. MEB111]|uniref:HAD domain-containing protein n=1 Tax=Promicromonospora sp. MEB111 TaxID=3040301 RepID=UPI002550E57D|nr:HAD domain-containing protein [Promicromonospora sp. MEB111]